jgi:hypothetical protein
MICRASLETWAEVVSTKTTDSQETEKKLFSDQVGNLTLRGLHKLAEFDVQLFQVLEAGHIFILAKPAIWIKRMGGIAMNGEVKSHFQSLSNLLGSADTEFSYLAAKLSYNVESKRTHGAIIQAITRMKKLKEQLEKEESWFEEQLNEEENKNGQD